MCRFLLGVIVGIFGYKIYEGYCESDTSDTRTVNDKSETDTE